MRLTASIGKTDATHTPRWQSAALGADALRRRVRRELRYRRGRLASVAKGGCRVVLVGMMGSGKSTVGRLLADATGWPLYDNDELLDRLYGLTPRQILDQSGEGELRASEDAALGAGLELRGPSIVDAAGGTILSESSRQLLSGVVVVWLRAAPETLYRRALGASHRPWLDTGGEEWIRAELGVRGPLYAAVADITVDTDTAAPADSAAEILTQLPELCRELRSTAP